MDSVNTSQWQALGSLPKVRDHVLVTAKVPDRRSKVSDVILNPSNVGWMLNMFDSAQRVVGFTHDDKSAAMKSEEWA